MSSLDSSIEVSAPALAGTLCLRNKMPLDLPGHEHTVSAAALEDDNLFVRFGNRGQTTVSALAKKST